VATPELHLATAFVFDGDHRITETREPNPSLPVRFVLARGAGSVAWAVRTDVNAAVAEELDALAASEVPHAGDDWQTPPKHAEKYEELLAMDFAEVVSGALFEFPAELVPPTDIVEVRTERDLATNFHGWVHGEISDGRAPVMAIVEDGAPVSICFCARRANRSAEAGVDTGERYRRRGHAARVTAAWALALRARRMTPLYSTAWTNDASLGVARKLGLIMYGSTWSMT
jgi:GNAT acetyltransferase-like protein